MAGLLQPQGVTAPENPSQQASLKQGELQGQD